MQANRHAYLKETAKRSDTKQAALLQLPADTRYIALRTNNNIISFPDTKLQREMY